MFAVVVSFTIKEGRMEDFLRLIRANATGARETEPGCRRFDVCTDPDRPNEVFLYELYDDHAALLAHQQTDHYKKTGPAVRDMIETRELKTYSRIAG